MYVFVTPKGCAPCNCSILARMHVLGINAADKFPVEF